MCDINSIFFLWNWAIPTDSLVNQQVPVPTLPASSHPLAPTPPPICMKHHPLPQGWFLLFRLLSIWVQYDSEICSHLCLPFSSGGYDLWAWGMWHVVILWCTVWLFHRELSLLHSVFLGRPSCSSTHTSLVSQNLSNTFCRKPRIECQMFITLSIPSS